jgi:hypothetical protein
MIPLAYVYIHIHIHKNIEFIKPNTANHNWFILLHDILSIMKLLEFSTSNMPFNATETSEISKNIQKKI